MQAPLRQSPSERNQSRALDAPVRTFPRRAIAVCVIPAARGCDECLGTEDTTTPGGSLAVAPDQLLQAHVFSSAKSWPRRESVVNRESGFPELFVDGFPTRTPGMTLCNKSLYLNENPLDAFRCPDGEKCKALSGKRFLKMELPSLSNHSSIAPLCPSTNATSTFSSPFGGFRACNENDTIEKILDHCYRYKTLAGSRSHSVSPKSFRGGFIGPQPHGN